VKRIVFVVADSLRPDVLSCHGGEAATPTVDLVAAGGGRFETTLSSSPWTLPSVAAMLTGCFGHRVGLIHWRQSWPGTFPTVFDRLSAAGWDCASFVFDTRYLFHDLAAAGVRGSSRHEDDVLAFIGRPPSRDQIVFVHYWGTHVPYVPGAMAWEAWQAASDALVRLADRGGAQREKVRELYRRAVRRFSEDWLPRLLRAIEDAGAATLLVLTADHGETWGERLHAGEHLSGVFDLHGNALFEESLRVPLIVRGPGVAAGSVVRGLARTVDLAPTLLDLAGLKGSPGLDGSSRVPSLAHGAPVPPRPAVAACNRTIAEMLADGIDRPGPADAWDRFALRSASRKWVTDARRGRTGFDLDADPGERSPLAGTGREWEDGWRALEAERRRATLAPIPEAVTEAERRKAAAAAAGIVRSRE
jgi:arylsulfatase A-like enzyme